MSPHASRGLPVAAIRSVGCASAVGIFLPVYLFTIIPAPWFSRNRDNALLKPFALGATAAATGATSGSVIFCQGSTEPVGRKLAEVAGPAWRRRQ